MVSLRVAVALAALVVVSASDVSFGTFGHMLGKMASKIWHWASHIGDHHGGGHHHHGHGKFRKMMKEAHQCHERCGHDAECHSKCPKPMEQFAKACHDFPAIQKCHASCSGDECQACPKFEVDWMNKKFAKHPERAAMIAEKKCPIIEKAQACHSACEPGDFECHHKCPKMFHHGHHFPGKWKHKFHHEMEKVHACHERCGSDSSCHAKCPKPWMKFVKACEEFPAIEKCRKSCKDAECEKCPAFDVPWLNKKMAKHPEHFMTAAEKKCPKMLKIHACHEACKPGDHECHHKCPSMWDLFHGHHGWHHHDHHHDRHHHDREWHNHPKAWEKVHHFLKKARHCHHECGKDAECHAKCPKPWEMAAQACKDYPSIKACHKTCSEDDCNKCPKFAKPWMNHKYAKHPEIFDKLSAKCGWIEKAAACHAACVPGDHECHHKCPHPIKEILDGHDAEMKEPPREDDVLV